MNFVFSRVKFDISVWIWTATCSLNSSYCKWFSLACRIIITQQKEHGKGGLSVSMYAVFFIQFQRANSSYHYFPKTKKKNPDRTSIARLHVLLTTLEDSFSILQISIVCVGVCPKVYAIGRNLFCSCFKAPRSVLFYYIYIFKIKGWLVLAVKVTASEHLIYDIC